MARPVLRQVRRHPGIHEAQHQAQHPQPCRPHAQPGRRPRVCGDLSRGRTELAERIPRQREDRVDHRCLPATSRHASQPAPAAVADPGQADGAGAGWAPGPTIHRSVTHTIRAHKPYPIRASAFTTTRTSSSTHASTQSGPSTPFTIAPAGRADTSVETSLACPDCRAEVRNACTLRVRSHSAMPGPPGATHASCTSPSTEVSMASSTRRSIAAHWPTAPAGVCGKPTATSATPRSSSNGSGTLIDAAPSIDDSGVNAACRSRLAIGAAAIRSRTDPACGAASAVAATVGEPPTAYHTVIPTPASNATSTTSAAASIATSRRRSHATGGTCNCEPLRRPNMRSTRFFLDAAVAEDAVHDRRGDHVQERGQDHHENADDAGLRRMRHVEHPARDDRPDRDHHPDAEQGDHTPQHVAGDVVGVLLGPRRRLRTHLHRHQQRCRVPHCHMRRSHSRGTHHRNHRHHRSPSTWFNTLTPAARTADGNGSGVKPDRANWASNGTHTSRSLARSWRTAALADCCSGRGQRRPVPTSTATIRCSPTRPRAESNRRRPGTVARATSTTAAADRAWSDNQLSLLSSASTSHEQSRKVHAVRCPTAGAGRPAGPSTRSCRRSITSPSRSLRTQPSPTSPSSAVLAAASPDADAEQHSTTRATPDTAPANDNATVEVPTAGAAPHTSTTRSVVPTLKP
ncbi:protein of unknown function [Micropruina glycogenica]|uniref:Uncharacterized protein n=1 Tax=Micropruina glycogenica TaxID=75385 RepID=A0A2N9JCL8_9ACTN|nr:protein of unknown function [Micropruina glycogenica]